MVALGPHGDPGLFLVPHIPNLTEREDKLGSTQVPGTSGLVPRRRAWGCDLFPILNAQPQPEMIQCHGLKYFQIVAAEKKAKAGETNSLSLPGPGM